MYFTEMQKLVEANVERYAKKHDIKIDQEFLMCKLMEETGEFAQALLIYDKKCRLDKRLEPQEARENLESELADILNCVFMIASKLEIDLYQAFNKKILEKGRVYLETQNNESKI